jgi:glycerol transport system ATP-binding protein
MYEGEIVQIGTPEELFENPQHKFVGYFIGSPGMNFLPCTLEGKQARVNGATIPWTRKRRPSGPKAEGAAGTGHPPHAPGGPHAKPSTAGVPATVTSMEDQGSLKDPDHGPGNHTLRARFPKTPVPEKRHG